MRQWLTRRWYGESAGPSLLQPLAGLYGLMTGLRRSAYASGLLTAYRTTKPVIVVGNLTVGGTGKTPLVAWLAQRLSASGLKVGIVSRGYGRASRPRTGPSKCSRHGPVTVHGESRWQEVGDEPLLLRELTGCDTVVSRDRVAGVRELVARGADAILADDGLQHLRLARDCEIVVVDGARGFGNGRLLPAGPLREPASRVRHADIVVVNGVPEHRSLLEGDFKLPSTTLQMKLVADEAVRLDALGSSQPLSSFRGRRVHAVAGIGNPSRFFLDLRRRGIEVIEHAFADHHAFEARDVDFGDGLAVLMTQKDAVKCRAFAGPHLWYVPVTAAFSNEHERALLESVVRKLGPAVRGG